AASTAAARSEGRDRRYLTFRALFVFFVSFVSLWSIPPIAEAAKFFHGEPRQVRACVLLLSSTSAAAPAYAPAGQNVNPYVFYVMDQRTDLRPDSWEFMNPMAPPLVTGAMHDRWASIAPGDDLTVGVPLTKNMAAYWEVPLRPEMMDRLVAMDVCYIGAGGG